MNKRDVILLEDMNNKLDALLEGQVAMGYVPRKIDAIDERLRAVLTDHSRELTELKQAVA